MEELNQIVQSMVDAGETESNIQLVIESYKPQEELAKTNDSANADPAVESNQNSMDSASANGSLEPRNASDFENTQEEATLIERTFGKNEFTDFFGDLYRSASAGVAAGSSVDEAFDIYKGKEATDEEVYDFLDKSRSIAEKGQTDEMIALSEKQEKLKKEGYNGVSAFLLGWWDNPSAMLQYSTMSLAQMATAFGTSEEVAGTALASAGVGAGLGAGAGLVGGPLAPVTSAAGAIVGTTAGFFGGLSGAMETGMTTASLIQEKAVEEGLDWGNMTDKERFNYVRKVQNNEEEFNDLKSRAVARGVTIGAIDSITAGITGGVGSAARKSVASGARSALAGAADVGAVGVTETIGGMLSETAGQAAAGQEFNLEEVLIEGFADKTFTGASVIKSAVQGGPKYSINGEKMNGKQFIDNIKALDDEVFVTDAIKVENSPAVDKLISDRRQNIAADQKVDSRISDVADRAQAINLNKELTNLKNNKEGNKTKITQTEASLEGISEKYKDSEVDVTIDQRKQAIANAVETKFEAEFNKNYKALKDAETDTGIEPVLFEDDNLFAEAAAKDLGLTKEYIIENAPEGVFVGKGKVYINKNQAKKSINIATGNNGAISVASHEVLHPIFNALIGGAKTQGQFVNQFKNQMTKAQKAYVNKRLKSSYADLPGAEAIELMNIFSDGIIKGDINYDKTTFAKLGNSITNLLRSAIGLKTDEISFEDGRGVFNFLKEYNTSIKEGKLSDKAIATIKTAESKEGATKVADAKTLQKEQFSKTLTPEQSASLSKQVVEIKRLSKENAEIAAKYNKEPIKGTKQTRLENQVREGIKPLVEKIVSNRTKALYDPIAPDAKKAVTRQEFQDSMRSDIEAMVLNEYDETKQDLEKFTVSRAYLRANDLAKRLGIESQEEGGIKKDVDAAKDIVSTKDTQSVDRSGSVERGQATFDELDIVDDKLISEIESEVSKELKMRASKGTLSEMVSVKRGRETYFVSWLENLVDKTLFKKILKKWGAIGEAKGVTVIPPGYIDFLNSKEVFNVVTKALPIKTIKKSYGKLFKIEKVGREKSAQGNPIFRIAPTDKKTFLQYFLDGKKTTILERQKQLAREIITPVTKEIVANYATPENLLNLKEIKELAPEKSIDVVEKISIEAQVNKLQSELDRYKGENTGFDIIQFSKNLEEYNINKKDTTKFFNMLIEGGIYSTSAKEFLLKKGVSEENYESIAGDLISEGIIAQMQEIKAANKGIKYEKALNNVLGKYTEAGLKVDLISRKKGDIKVSFGKNNYKIEVKLNDKAQIGSASAGPFVKKDGKITLRDNLKLSKKISDSNFNKFIDFINSEETQKYLKDLVKAINKANSKSDDKATISRSGHIKLPNPEFWDNIKNEMPKKQGGYVSYEGNQSIVEDFYKGIDLIQIGDQGAYSIGNDSKLSAFYEKLSAVVDNVYRPVRTGTTVYMRLFPNFKEIKNNKQDSLDTKQGISKLAETTGLIIQYSKSRSEIDENFNNIIEGATKGSKSRINTNTVPVYHGGEVNSIKDINGFIYFSDDKAQAQYYANVNYGNVKNFTLKESDIVPEADVFKVIRELNIQPRVKGWTIDDSRLYELIDDRFDNAFTKEDMKKLKAGLKKKGIKASRFTDSDMKTGKDIENIVVFDKSIIQFSKTVDQDFNNIIEKATGIESAKTMSGARSKVLGQNKGKFKFFIPPSADDFAGLVSRLLGKGKEGDANAAWFKENLFDPFAKGIRDYESYKEQSIAIVRALKKSIRNIPNGLKKVNDTGFTNEQAVRVYMWVKNGYDIKDLSEADQKELVKVIEDNKALKDFADELDESFGGYPEPDNEWLGGSIVTDMLNMVNTSKRAEFLQSWQENSDIVFSKENLNKLRAAYGDNYVEALEDMLYRMKTGRNRPSGSNKLTNKFMNWVNDSVGTIMFFNTRSALLQTLSIANFINWKENNPAKAAMAFANQKQFWSDFAMLFNSDFLKQRRGGLKNDVNADELASAAETATNKPRAVLSSILKAGFLPTQMADSFAIAMGGASFIRNRINKYVSEGMDVKAAEEKSFLDFQEIAEETQQSSRPDRVSQQQASPLGRIVLAFANTPMQYMRLTKKAYLDLKNGRGDAKTNISKIVYYTVLQNVIFGALQSALFASLFEDEEDEELKNKEIRIANSMLDSILRGLGIYGAIASTGKNIILEVKKQADKPRPDFTQVAIKSLDLSPPLSSKLRKMISTGRAFSYKNVRDKMTKSYGLENPAYYAIAQSVSAVTNVPIDRAIKKADNIRVAMDNDTKLWQSIALSLGYSQWDLGLMETAKSKKDKRKVLKRRKLIRKKLKRQIKK